MYYGAIDAGGVTVAVPDELDNDREVGITWQRNGADLVVFDLDTLRVLRQVEAPAPPPGLRRTARITLGGYVYLGYAAGSKSVAVRWVALGAPAWRAGQSVDVQVDYGMPADRGLTIFRPGTTDRIGALRYVPPSWRLDDHRRGSARGHGDGTVHIRPLPGNVGRARAGRAGARRGRPVSPRDPGGQPPAGAGARAGGSRPGICTGPGRGWARGRRRGGGGGGRPGGPRFAGGPMPACGPVPARPWPPGRTRGGRAPPPSRSSAW